MAVLQHDNVSFVLVEPETPGNVGSAARAIKTMGFSRLILINPCDHLSREARMLAHGSDELLDRAQVVPSLGEAIGDKHLVIATTNRLRDYHYPIFSPEEVGRRCLEVSGQHRIALVFGRESSGLTNEEISACHLMSSVPAAASHPSLNLAQAVMLYAYALHNATLGDAGEFEWNLATYNEVDAVYTHLHHSLQRVDFRPKDNWPAFLMRFKRIFSRANPEVRDVKLMHKILQAFDYYIDHLEGKRK